MAAVVPRCLALVICDLVGRGGRAAEPFLVRGLQTFHVQSFPSKTEPFSVWVQVTDGSGRASMNLLVEYLPAETLEPDVVVRIDFSLNFQSPNDVLDHLAAFANGIELKQSGRYRVRLIANGTTISQRYFAALRTSSGGSP
jgi:hypothetical protein